MKAAAAGAAVVLAALVRGARVPALVAALLLLCALVLPRRRRDALWQALVGLCAAGLGLTLLPELVVLTGDISRMNTVFKLSLQAWVLFGLAAAAAAARNALSLPRWGRGARALYRRAFVALAAACALYPLLATPARLADRFVALPPTLDGGAFLEKAVYEWKGATLPLAPDAHAMLWLEDNVRGSPVIAEANTEPFLYGWGNRFSMFTGLPGIIGWGWHQKQQRGVVSGDLLAHPLEGVEEPYQAAGAGFR